MPMRLHEEADPTDKARFEATGLEIAAHFYDKSQQWLGEDGILNIRSWGPGTVPDSSAVVMDIEKGSLDRINPHYWKAETSIGSWYYNGTDGVELRTNVIIHNLCDIVSKNENLLLNLGLKPDGTLLENERQTLREIGEWLQIHGEGIYGTRHWKVFGDVDTEIVPGDFKQNDRPMTSKDIRYTSKDGSLFAFFMDKPESGRVELRSVREDLLGEIEDVVLMSEGISLDWSFDGENGMVVNLPASYDEQHAYGLRIIDRP